MLSAVHVQLTDVFLGLLLNNNRLIIVTTASAGVDFLVGECIQLFMDLLTWFLIGWIGLASIVYFIFEKLLDLWPGGTSKKPPQVKHSEQTRQSDDYYHQEDYLRSQNKSESYLPNQSSYNEPPAKQIESGSTDWLNDFIAWLYRYYRTTPEFIVAWVRSLNEASKKVANVVSSYRNQALCIFAFN